MPSDRCKHGMDERFCGICHPQPKKPNRALSAAKPAKSKANDSGDYFILQGDPQKADFNRLGRGIKTVHFVSPPSVDDLYRVIERTPDLRSIEIIPAHERFLTHDKREICSQAHIAIQIGHAIPELAWEEARKTSPHYRAKRDFLLNLSGDQKARFDELLEFGIPAALMTSRYFCLHNEEYMGQLEIGITFGFKDSFAHSHVSQWIRAVFFYLNPKLKVGTTIEKIASGLVNRIERLRLTRCPKPSELTREQRLYLIWKMGSVERVNWDAIRLDPLGFKTDPEKRHFLSEEGDRGEYLRTRRIGTGRFSYWKKEPPKFPILDQLLEYEEDFEYEV